jgi:hypothetical protein
MTENKGKSSSTSKEPTLAEAIRQADIISIEYKLYHVDVRNSGITEAQITTRINELGKPMQGRSLGWRRVIDNFLREQRSKLLSI